VLHADPASLARYIVPIIRGMFSSHSSNLLPNIGRLSPRLGSLHGSSFARGFTQPQSYLDALACRAQQVIGKVLVGDSAPRSRPPWRTERRRPTPCYRECRRLQSSLRGC
jgi:hypothetical protein